MSGLVSNVGLFSGLPVTDIIDQLMAIESQPLARVQNRIQDIQAQRTGIADLNARLLALKSAANRFDTTSFFRSSATTSSHPDVLTATAAEGASIGAYAFRVGALTSSHQLISRGYSNADRTAVGSGSVTIEVGRGQVAPPSFLDDLNGRRGVRRGTIEIVDQAGGIARLDLSSAMTVEDVLARINAEPAINVRASVSGDHFVLTDRSLGDGALTVRDIGNGTMAADLGVVGSVSAATGRALQGRDIRSLNDETPLELLNDRNGVRRNPTGADLIFGEGGTTLFEVELGQRMDATTPLLLLNDGNGVALGSVEVTTRDGTTTTVDLAAESSFGGAGPRMARTVGEVVDLFNAAGGAAFSMSLDINTNQLVLTDLTTGDEDFVVTEVDDGATAGELGLTPAARDGVIRSAETYRVQTVGDALRAINYATGNYDFDTDSRRIEARISDNGMVLERQDGGDFTVTAGVLGERVSGAGTDLGLLGDSTSGTLASRQLMAGLNTVLLSSLHGGQGVALGILEITAADGSGFVVDLASPDAAGRAPATLQDVIERINTVAAGVGVALEAGVNRAGNGLALIDHSEGEGTIRVSTGSTADVLGLSGREMGPDGILQGRNLQLQYISSATPLARLNQGDGVGTGIMEITASNGVALRVDITSNQKTVGDVIDLINVLGTAQGITAAVNGTGDGIVLRDTTGGSEALTVEDRDGAVAERLRLTQAAQSIAPATPGDAPVQAIDGRFEITVRIDADDSLNEVARKINAAGAGVSATVINDGSDVTPFRISVTSGTTGTAGALVFDTSDTGLELDTLVAAQDAVVFFGGSTTTSPVVIRSSSNTLSGVIDKVTIDLKGTSDEPVELNITRDVDTMVAQLEAFTSGYNDVVQRVDELTFFDSDTFESGVLRGDSTIRRLEGRLREMITTLVPTDERTLNRFSAVGITFSRGETVDLGDGETGVSGRNGTIEFDAERFREAFADDPEAVEQLFTLFETVEETRLGADGTPEVVRDPATGEIQEVFRGLGLGHRIEEIIDELTRSGDGLLTLRDDALQGQVDLFTGRVDSINTLLDAKRARLERQFAALEQSISLLSGQQSSLTALQRPAT